MLVARRSSLASALPRIAASSAFLLLMAACEAPREPAPPETVFRVRLPADVDTETITGRIYVLVSEDPRMSARTRRSFGHQPVSDGAGAPFFAVDVEAAAPGSTVVIDGSAIGYPVENLASLEPGDYYVQALLNVYTRFERADGHTIWAHMDQWEGQHFNWSPGNFLSPIEEATLDPAAGFDVELGLSEEIPPIEAPPDTSWVKRVKIESRLLSEFWGRPIYLGATVLLPRDYQRKSYLRYPAIYYQGHFSLEAPFGFSTEPVEESEAARARRLERNLETGNEFYRSWISNGFPRMVAVTFQHPTPYFDDSYAVNSANNGPYADALLTELIPYLEKEFRLIPEGFARVLTGGSTGGYEALALQVHHPRFFGGTWVFYPDPVDFRRLFQINIYEDDNAFYAPGYQLLRPVRYSYRAPDGQPLQSVRQLSRLHAALGTRGRSCDYLEAWEAAFGPTGDDGYPRPLWDRETGVIDREVAGYWRDRGYDLSYYLKENWDTIGADLRGKIRVYCGDMDHYYFNLAAYRLQEVLESRANPPYGGAFVYGRPLKGHGWRPMTHAELVRQMAVHIASRMPAGSPIGWLRD